jgi:hypothetical protein
MDNKIRKIVRECIREILMENENSGVKKLYHQTSFSIDKFRSIFKNGLIPRDNGESNCVWFSVDNEFYRNNPNILTISVDFNDEFKNKHRFNDNVSVINVYDIVKPNELNIVDCPFLIDAESGDVILNISSRNSLKKFSDRRGYECISEYIVNNKQLKNKYLILFSDLYNKYVETDTLNYFYGVDNIKLINLFE